MGAGGTPGSGVGETTEEGKLPRLSRVLQHEFVVMCTGGAPIKMWSLLGQLRGTLNFRFVPEVEISFRKELYNGSFVRSSEMMRPLLAGCRDSKRLGSVL